MERNPSYTSFTRLKMLWTILSVLLSYIGVRLDDDDDRPIDLSRVTEWIDDNRPIDLSRLRYRMHGSSSNTKAFDDDDDIPIDWSRVRYRMHGKGPIDSWRFKAKGSPSNAEAFDDDDKRDAKNDALERVTRGDMELWIPDGLEWWQYKCRYCHTPAYDPTGSRGALSGCDECTQ